MLQPTKAPSAHDVSVLRDINLTVNDGEFLVLVGPSGCGKSTLLRLIAGLEALTAGNIWVGDRLMNQLPPKQRDIAMVFQNYALYPHLTVYDNLAFGLRRMNTPPPQHEHEKTSGNSSPAWITTLKQRAATLLTRLTRPLPSALRYWSAQERQVNQRVREVASILQIEALLDRLPKQLSGGQKQRVALGRAMARNPQVFLMDEPLSNLDAKLRTETRAQIVALQRKLGTTTIYVTHDQTEAMTMGDRIVVMNGGQIQQIANPIDLYNRPANRFVAEFIGTMPMNFFPVEVKAPSLISHPAFRLMLPDTWELPLRRYDGRSLILGIRPEHLSLGLPAPKNIPVRVSRIETLGSDTHLTVRLSVESPSSLTASGSAPAYASPLPDVDPDLDTVLLQLRISPDQATFIDEKLWLAIDPQKVHLFDPDTHQAILPTQTEPLKSS
ncbi:MAG: ATP-binding cassette domain-containing protein [Leptolyngbyaceae bacterium]|nr:ATP-binding cassette domain-containing protein [Leptolyngbyaceae bacterium]